MLLIDSVHGTADENLVLRDLPLKDSSNLLVWDGLAVSLLWNAHAPSKVAILEIIPGEPVVTWR